MAARASLANGRSLTEPAHTGRPLLIAAGVQARRWNASPITGLPQYLAATLERNPPVPQPASRMGRSSLSIADRCAATSRFACIAANHHIRSSIRSSLSYSEGFTIDLFYVGGGRFNGVDPTSD